jgi:uncharacterized membrane protein YphA (DoxX/SURF4 family)
MKLSLNRAWAILFARLILGLIFFMAGVMKVFSSARSSMPENTFCRSPILSFRLGRSGQSA